MKPKAKPKKLTPKSLGFIDDVKLSDRYANTQTNFKIVSDAIIGFYVTGDGARSPIRIAPIYRAEIWFRKGKGKFNQIVTSHEIGPYYNPPRDPHAEPDEAGDGLAHLAAIAVGTLQRHAEVRAAKPKKVKRP